MKKVFIIVLNWNGKKDTIECLESLKKLQNPNSELLTMVVDNGSTDGSVGKIKNETLRFHSGRELKIIENKKNLGFAGGNNVGIKYALENGADWVVILNNDTVVPENFLDLLDNAADLAGPVIKFRRDGRWVYDYGGYLNWWTGRPKHYELPYHSCAEAACHPSPLRTPDYLSGCCLAIKREVFDKIGLFDKHFFLYFEDVDFCLRAQKAGFKVALEPKVVIFHKLGGTIGRQSGKNIFHNLKSNFIFINKHLGWRRPIGYLYLAVLSIKIIVR